LNAGNLGEVNTHVLSGANFHGTGGNGGSGIFMPRQELMFHEVTKTWNPYVGCPHG